jgi:hypothetical protein
VLRTDGAARRGPRSLWDLYEIAPAPLSISYAELDKYLPCRKVSCAAFDRYREEQPMLDLILLAFGLGIFAVSVAYVFGCDRL